MDVYSRYLAGVVDVTNVRRNEPDLGRQGGLHVNVCTKLLEGRLGRTWGEWKGLTKRHSNQGHPAFSSPDARLIHSPRAHYPSICRYCNRSAAAAATLRYGEYIAN